MCEHVNSWMYQRDLTFCFGVSAHFISYIEMIFTLTTPVGISEKRMSLDRFSPRIPMSWITEFEKPQLDSKQCPHGTSMNGWIPLPTFLVVSSFLCCLLPCLLVCLHLQLHTVLHVYCYYYHSINLYYHYWYYYCYFNVINHLMFYPWCCFSVAWTFVANLPVGCMFAFHTPYLHQLHPVPLLFLDSDIFEPQEKLYIYMARNTNLTSEQGQVKYEPEFTARILFSFMGWSSDQDWIRELNGEDRSIWRFTSVYHFQQTGESKIRQYGNSGLSPSISFYSNI